MTCGRSLGAVKKAEAGDPLVLPGFDTEAEERARLAEREEWNQAAATRRATEKAEWFREHDAYLRTPAWASRRERILSRAGYRCEAAIAEAGCTGRATDVHHLTYDHWRAEPLFDLRALCRPCHEAITQMDRARRGEAAS
jgi:hypothetical protein